MTPNAWLIPLFPLIAFAIITLRGERLPGRGAPVSIAAIVLAGLAGLQVLGEVAATGARADLTYPWVTLGNRPLTVGFVVDPLSAVMLAMDQLHQAGVEDIALITERRRSGGGGQ